MAAKSGAGDALNAEVIVNRWVVDYYSLRALEFFKSSKVEAFAAIRDLLDILLSRPVESTEDLPLRIRVMQFLSRINEGENLDIRFEPDSDTTPLESALSLLESVREQFNLPKEEYEVATMSLKEMIVVSFIKNGDFDKAKEMLKMYFPKPGSGRRSALLELISQKNKNNLLFNYQRFREEMVAFSHKICSFGTPFLYKTAKDLILKRSAGCELEEAEETVEETAPQSSTHTILIQTRLLCECSFSGKYVIIPRSRLEEVYTALTGGGQTFAQLEVEVEAESHNEEFICPQLPATPNTSAAMNPQQEAPPERDSCSPMEASPADQLPETDAGLQMQPTSLSSNQYTVARLVMEPDSQPSSEYTTGLEELETEASAENQLALSSSSGKRDLECPVTDEEDAVTAPKRARRSKRSLYRNSNRSMELSSSEEGQHTHASSRQTSKNTPPRTSKNIDICPSESSLDSISVPSQESPVPAKSSTPDSKQGCLHAKWKALCKKAKETKDTWSDEELDFPPRKQQNSSETSYSSHRRKWSTQETENLIEGVKKFGEGNWNRILAYYHFENRTNVNLKDRWRTMKKKNMV